MCCSRRLSFPGGEGSPDVPVPPGGIQLRLARDNSHNDSSSPARGAAGRRRGGGYQAREDESRRIAWFFSLRGRSCGRPSNRPSSALRAPSPGEKGVFRVSTCRNSLHVQACRRQSCHAGRQSSRLRLPCRKTVLRLPCDFLLPGSRHAGKQSCDFLLPPGEGARRADEGEALLLEASSSAREDASRSHACRREAPRGMTCPSPVLPVGMRHLGKIGN